MSDETKKWYQNIPDVLKALAVVITAITGLVIALDKPSDKEEDSRPTEPTIHAFDGKYQGIRGYTDEDRKSTHKYCLKRYNFIATITNSTITFNSDKRTFKGLVNTKGDVYMDETDIWPQPQQDLVIKGSIHDAKMTSAYCGNGYFRLRK